MILVSLLAASVSGASGTYRYHPKYHVPPSLESVLRQLTPGQDAFPAEKAAEELGQRLGELSALLRAHAGLVPEAAGGLLAPDFKGGRLTPAEEVPVGSSPQLEIFRARALPPDLVRDRGSFRKELAALVSGLESVQVAEFLITGIDEEGAPDPLVRTVVRYDIAGATRSGGRAERLGRWQLRWRRGTDAVWRLTEWIALEHRRSQAPAPVFSEVTDSALGGNLSFRRQLVPGLDFWAAHLDAVFQPRGMGHHGVSVGDFDGDGRDDFYVSQPEGLPNRLFRNKGDGTFEDVTEAAGLGVLDRTSESLFVDVDNDGNQDLILLTRTGPMLFRGDGKGHFARDPDAFQFQRPLQGSLTSAAAADYDRDGFLDLYLCAYGYYIGVSEDKAGPPSPYHDALNGSPNVLLHNDGHGRFVDVTDAAGLDQNNDRFSFAPAWADYDEDGWPDLLVANDFGRKNLYHNEGLVNGQIRFKDVAAEAGVEDYGAGMSAAFVDYDNDGHLDIYTGNMWTAAGQRVTAQPGFKPDAPPEIRDIYRRHVRGNSLFRNRGDGTFEDVTLAAGAEFGRWAWSSDAFDFDSDGWDDLYVANGMFTRDAEDPSLDVDSFFWRQVVAQSPLTRKPGAAYDDGWRATNRLVSNGAQAQHERNVLLRNDGKGQFDDVSATAGLDLDQDGRSFAVFDYDLDGDPDLVLLAPRSSPQLRLFRNDYAGRGATLAVRLIGTRSNRDAIGARVTVETDQLRVTRIVQAGSGFISQHSKELLFGLGSSKEIRRATIVWPSGLTQTVTSAPLDHRVWIEEGNAAVRSEPFRKASVPSPATAPRPPATTAESASSGTWLYQPFPAPDFSLKDLQGQDHSLSSLAGRPAVVLFWATWAPPSRAALEEVARGAKAFAAAGASVLAVAVDAPADEAKVRAAVAATPVPVLVASEEVAGAYSILNRYVFDRREDLPLPTVFLVSGQGDIVKVYREPIVAARILEDIPRIATSPGERLARAVPFAGTFYASPGERNEFQYALELSEQGFDTPAMAVFERVAKLDPTAITLYNLGTLYLKRGNPLGARAAFERALEMQPESAEASNSLGALLAQSGEVPAAIERFRAALQARPDFPDALNNLGFALFQTGQAPQAFELYEKALALQPGFPEALNNLGIFFGRQGDLDRARTYFQQAVEKRPSYGEAANNLALVLGAQGDAEGAITVLLRALQENPAFEMTYVTLSRIYLRTGRRREAIQVLEKLLQRNPNNALGLEVLRHAQAGN